MAALCLLLTGCGGRDAPPDPAVLGPALLESGGFPQDMLALDEDMAAGVFQLDMDTVTACYAAVSAAAAADEALVLTAADEDAAQAAYDLLAGRLEHRRESFSDYAPAEAEKLSEAILRREGCSVVLCVCGDYDAARAVLDG